MYKTKEYKNLFGLAGFSDQLLENHFKLYKGYVANTNKLIELRKNTHPGSLEHAEITPRFGWEYNGMRLHELYFDSLSKTPIKASDNKNIYDKICNQFGSFETWRERFIATGMMRGIGWVVLYQDKQSGSLFNTWINEHDLGHLTGAQPLVIMDVFEHAFITDYGLNRKLYIEAFFNSIDWEIIENRFNTK